MNVMNYDGHHARIEYDDEDEIFFGKIAGISDVVGFPGSSVVDGKDPQKTIFWKNDVQGKA